MSISAGKIREYLLATRMRQYELAAKLGVSEAFFSKVARGRVKPSKRLMEDLQKVLNGKVGK